MGDFFARDVGPGHVAGLPFQVLALLIVVVDERFDRIVHQAYYCTGIIIVRAAATNFADFACGDMKLTRLQVMAGLAALLVAALFARWQFVWRRDPERADDGAQCFAPTRAVGPARSSPERSVQ